MSLPYYKRYPRDFIEGTIGMSLELKGAYGIILDLIYMQNGGLPDDAKYISGLLGCTVRKWNSIRKELLDLDKIQVNCELLSNYRADKERETLRKLQLNNAEKGRRYKKNNGLATTPVEPARVKPEPEPYKKKDSLSLLGKSHSKPESNYSEDFETFWIEFPETTGTSKKAAFAQWKKLSSVDRKKAKATIPDYIAYLETEKHRAHHAERFISKRIFETMSATESGQYAGMTVQQILHPED